jgi:hypothetical protein
VGRDRVKSQASAGLGPVDSKIDLGLGVAHAVLHEQADRGASAKQEGDLD